MKKGKGDTAGISVDHWWSRDWNREELQAVIGLDINIDNLIANIENREKEEMKKETKGYYVDKIKRIYDTIKKWECDFVTHFSKLYLAQKRSGGESNNLLYTGKDLKIRLLGT